MKQRFATFVVLPVFIIFIAMAATAFSSGRLDSNGEDGSPALSNAKQMIREGRQTSASTHLEMRPFGVTHSSSIRPSKGPTLAASAPE